ncbi:hypothetical protein AB0J83_43210 [Actinoplanes sp. NPDC049596]|uniref:hypothetical protein n=1 Tax=unclassified Actinoplanes TaxID=2626549 RepID=UPI0034268C04
MTERTNFEDVDVIVDHRLVGIVDEASDGGEKPPSPHTLGDWIAVTPGNIYLECPGEEVLGAAVRFETWDGPAPFDETDWEAHDVVEVVLPSGLLGIDEITMGAQSGVYRLPPGRRWHTRLAWRTLEAEPDQLPSATILAQFWPAD